MMSNDGMKRPLESGDDNGIAILKKRRGEGPHIEFRGLIPSKSAGAVIGRGGANIRRLRQDFKASVTVPDSQGPERILTIGANVGTVCEILVELLPTLDDAEKRGGDQEMRFLVHQSQAGCIIGKAGFKIKELREEFGVNIKVFTQPCPQSTERTVAVQGNPSAVVNCIAQIYELLESAPVKGFNQPYDPHNFDEFYASDYGGYTGGAEKRAAAREAAMGGAPGMRGGPMGPMGGQRGRGGGLMGGSGMGRGGAAGGMGDFGGGYTQDTMSGQGMMFSNQPTTTTQVSIPKDLAGAIIGKGGTRIRQIRQESGATINIAEPNAASNDRIITITGTQEQIQNAQYLLQMSVKQFSGKY